MPPELAEKRVPSPEEGWDNDKKNPFENNIKNTNLIFGAFRDNDMVTIDESTRSVTLEISLGQDGFWIKRAIDPDFKYGTDCYFGEFRMIGQYRRKDWVQYYVDIRCDGTLDSTNLNKMIWPTNEDHGRYREFLEFLAKSVPVARSYKNR